MESFDLYDREECLVLKNATLKTHCDNQDTKAVSRRNVLGHRQKVENCSALFLALWLSLGFLQASSAGINAGESANPPDLQSPPGDYFSNWFKRVDETQAERMCCNFVVEPKVGVNDRKFSSSQRTDRE